MYVLQELGGWELVEMVRRCAQLSSDHFQQAGLTRAIAADERDPLARLDAERRGVEKLVVTKGERYAIQGEQGHASSVEVGRRQQGRGRTLS